MVGEWLHSRRESNRVQASNKGKCTYFPTDPFVGPSNSPYNTPPCEVLMPFTIRPDRRFPVCCPVTYQCGLFEGHGTVWNLSLAGGGSLAISPCDQGNTLAHRHAPDFFSILLNIPDSSPVSNVATVWVYVFPLRSHSPQWDT